MGQMTPSSRRSRVPSRRMNQRPARRGWHLLKGKASPSAGSGAPAGAVARLLGLRPPPTAFRRLASV